MGPDDSEKKQSWCVSCYERFHKRYEKDGKHNLFAYFEVATLQIL